MSIHKKKWLRFFIGFLFCLLIRLIPLRPPNIEPILATQMPFSKAYGKITGFLFGFLSMVFYDIITAQIGIWTFITASAYGFLGLWASVYFKNKNNNAWNYAKFAIIGTLTFDAVTGLSIGPLFFHQPIGQAFIGQIPFSLLHLLGNISFALIMSPAINNLLTENNESKKNFFINVWRPKII